MVTNIRIIFYNKSGLLLLRKNCFKSLTVKKTVGILLKQGFFPPISSTKRHFNQPNGTKAFSNHSDSF